MIKPNEFQYDEAPAKEFIKANQFFVHELQFIAKAKGIPNYLEMTREELGEAIINHKKQIKKES